MDPLSSQDPETLCPVGVLSAFTGEEIAELGGHGTLHRVGSGEVLIREHDTQDNLYILVSGHLRVYRRSGGFESSLGDIRPGESCGEMNFFDQGEASATVRAMGHAVVWKMTRPDFEKFVETHPRTANKLFRSMGAVVARRLREALDKLSKDGRAVLEGLW